MNLVINCDIYDTDMIWDWLFWTKYFIYSSPNNAAEGILQWSGYSEELSTMYLIDTGLLPHVDVCNIYYSIYFLIMFHCGSHN